MRGLGYGREYRGKGPVSVSEDRGGLCLGVDRVRGIRRGLEEVGCWYKEKTRYGAHLGDSGVGNGVRGDGIRGTRQGVRRGYRGGKRGMTRGKEGGGSGERER